jgi:hypothetical protein
LFSRFAQPHRGLIGVPLNTVSDEVHKPDAQLRLRIAPDGLAASFATTDCRTAVEATTCVPHAKAMTIASARRTTAGQKRRANQPFLLSGDRLGHMRCSDAGVWPIERADRSRYFPATSAKA